MHGESGGPPTAKGNPRRPSEAVHNARRSFFDDPVFSWILPHDADRGELLPGFFEIINRANIGHGEVYTTDDVAAGAVWVPPGVDDDGEQLAEALGQLMGPAMEKMYQIFQLLSEKHPRTAHYYLFFLGTTPNRQSQGIGTKLMKLVLDRCDREAIPAYLEASSEDNKRLYLRHGFDVTEEIRLPDGPPVWCMWRTPG